MFSSVFFIVLFYGLCLFSIFCDGGREKICGLSAALSSFQKKILWLFLFFFALFVLYWVQQTRFVFYWDYGGYWNLSINQMCYMSNHSFLDVVKTLIESINNAEYNIFLPSVISLPLSIFGYSFQKYTAICSFIFLIPTFFIQGLIVCRMIQNDVVKKSNLYVASVILAACFPASYYAVFKGYIDVGYLLPMSAVMLLFIDYDFKRTAVSRNLAIALLLVMIWICRRYTIYFIIGFVVAMMIKALAVLIVEKNTQTLKSIVVNFLQIGITSLGILLLFFREFFLRALLTNYGYMYSAYDGTLAYKVSGLAATFGYVSVIIIVVAGIMCFVSRKQIVNYLALSLMAIVEIILFWKTQAMDCHHRMILILPVFLLCMMIFELWGEVRNKDSKRLQIYTKNAVVVMCLLLITMNFTKAFSADLSTTGCGKLLSERYYPLKRDDIKELNQMVSYLNELTMDTDDYIYVAASGGTLSSDLLRKLSMPETDNAIPNMLNTNDIDLRDGFPAHFLKAKFVLTSDPVETHLPTGQEVVTYLANNVQDSNSYMGRHFELITQFKLGSGVVAKLYCKTSEFTEEDLQQIRDYYTNLYPGYEEIFAERIA